MAPTRRSKWSEVRLWLILFLVMIAATYVFGRPGDAEAGMVGGVIFGVIGLGVVAVELVGRRLIRKHSGLDGEPPSPRQP